MGTKVGLTGITFGDATVQNTAPVTSAVAGSGISVSGSTGAVTFTNSGVTSLVAGSGISVSGATGAVTVSATGGGTVTSVSGTNGLTGTVTTSGSLSVDTTFGNVGTYALLSLWTRTGLIAGATASGSVLGYTSALSTNGTNRGVGIGDSPVRTGNVQVPGSPGNVSYVTTTAASGTWRCMGGSLAGGYNGCDNTSSGAHSLWVRIS